MIMMTKGKNLKSQTFEENQLYKLHLINVVVVVVALYIEVRIKLKPKNNIVCSSSFALELQ